MSKASDWFDIDAADAPVGAKTSDLNAELAPKKRPAEAGSKRCAAPPVVDDEADDQALRDLEQQAAPQPALTYAGVATLLNKADSPRRCRMPWAPWPNSLVSTAREIQRTSWASCTGRD